MNPWLKIQLTKEFFIYKVEIKTMNKTSIGQPLTASIRSRDQPEVTLRSVCKEKQHGGPHLEYSCFPPVQGDFLRIFRSSVKTVLTICHVSIFGLGQ